MFKKLIVGIDFSAQSEHAARTAIGLAQGLGAEVVLVHVVGQNAGYTDPTRFANEVRPGLEQQLGDLVAKLGAGTGVKLDWGVVDGSPAEEISTFAERWGGDLIVAGTHGRSALPRMLTGSVADRLVRIARVPVLVVGPAAA